MIGKNRVWSEPIAGVEFDRRRSRSSAIPGDIRETYAMRGLRFDRLLSGAALALPLAAVLGIPFSNAQANTQTPAAIESAVPMPDTATLAPPTAADAVTPSGTEGIGSTTETAPAANAPAETTGTTTPAETTTAPATTPPATTPAETATATPEAPPPDPLASLDPGDRPIAERIRDMLPKADRNFASRKERIAVEAFYQKRNYAPVWFERGALSARTSAAVARIHASAADGLIPAEYKIPDMTAASPDAQADAELRLTATLLTFTRHLQAGRFPYARMGGEIMYPQEPPDVTASLNTIVQATDVAAAIDTFSPPQPGYRALKAKLAELRSASASASADVGPARIADGPAIKFGMKDARVPLLRERLGLHGKPADILYDKALYNAVRSVQFRKGMKPSGIVDAHTIAAINGPKPGDLVARVRANMERWRWLPRDLGRTYVMVNIPDYTLKVMSEGRQVWTTKIVSGKPQTPTPLVSAPMQHIIVNPSWYVPQSIIQNELLPLYASDPQIFDRMGLEVKQGPDGHINVVQPPGAANALGRIKFAFPNKFQVYLHDTPEKRLFSYSKRAFSHGCMRVEDPTKFGEVILSLAMSGPTPNARQIRNMFGQDERDFKLINRPMVHLTYQTAFVDDDGKLQIRDDIYGFDSRIHAILTTDERRIADIAPPPDPKRDLDTERSNQEILSRVERREAGNPFAFFEKLFR